MAQFGDLPKELVIMIAERVLPEDIESFALTSPTIYSLAASAIRDHCEKGQKYEHCVCVGFPSPLSKLLDEVLLCPDIAFYIKRITIDTWLNCWLPIGPITSPHPPFSADKLLRLKDAAVKLALPGEQKSLTAGIETGDEDYIIAMLLVLLRNVQCLTLGRIGYSHEKFTATLQRISKTPGTPALLKLKEVTLNNEFSGPDPNAWLAIKLFAVLPAMESITAMEVEVDESTTDDEYRLQPYSSGVTSLVFRACSIDSKRLYEFLEGFKALRHFTYTCVDDGHRPFEPFWIRIALLAHAKTSLTYLDLRSGVAASSILGSLRELKALQRLNTDLELLVGFVGSPRKQLADVLPLSIEQIHLHDFDFGSPKTIENLITRAAEDKREHLPNLKELRVTLYMSQMNTTDREAIVVRMQPKCRDAGFDLIID